MKACLLIAIACLVLIPACSTTEPEPDRIVTPPLDGPRDNVLFNLEAAYNQRNLNAYQKVLDDAFVFHFSAADVANGNVSVSQWDRAQEINATTNIFDKNFNPPSGSPISSIDLSLTYPNGEDVWNLVNPDGNHPGETWYEKTVDYFLPVVAGDFTYTSGNPIKASYIVRWGKDPTSGDEFWRIVAWRDDIGS